MFVSISLYRLLGKYMCFIFFFFQAEDGIRDLVRSRGLGDVYKRQRDRCDDMLFCSDVVPPMSKQLLMVLVPKEGSESYGFRFTYTCSVVDSSVQVNMPPIDDSEDPFASVHQSITDPTLVAPVNPPSEPSDLSSVLTNFLARNQQP
eukprot:TRINITY_DN5938_c0_g1_i1.p1 TRINITY_DN5938_c0_g1~~TRINITY_DN5938_c0_g1_i1.p1  ORF type:complete len:147 (+),score=34.10 TRINITY_DN5938_c0_g1_i1:35-475(+)